MMERQVEIFVAILLVVTGLSHVARPRTWVAFFQMLGAKGDAGVFLIALMHLPLGALIVTFHNVWTGVAIIVTLIGWGWLIKGALYLTIPRAGAFWLRRLSIDTLNEFRIGGLVLIALAGAIAAPLVQRVIG